MSTVGKIVVGIFVVSLLPIWRVAGQSDTGMNFWDYVRLTTGGMAYRHISSEEAIMDAQQAYVHAQVQRTQVLYE